MLLDFQIRVEYPEQWTRDGLEMLESRIRELASAETTDDRWTLRIRMELDEGDLWDACYEYEGFRADVSSLGPVSVPERPLIDGMGNREKAGF